MRLPRLLRRLAMTDPNGGLVDRWAADYTLALRAVPWNPLEAWEGGISLTENLPFDYAPCSRSAQGGGTGASTWEQENPKPRLVNYLKTRRVPPVGCTLCWASLILIFLLKNPHATCFLHSILYYCVKFSILCLEDPIFSRY